MSTRFSSGIHFCEECYSKRDFSSAEICPIKECNKKFCEFKGIHAPNGIEYCLGCFQCRLESIKNNELLF